MSCELVFYLLKHWIKQRQQSRFDVKFYKNITGVSVPSHLQGQKLAKVNIRIIFKILVGLSGIRSEETEHLFSGMNKHSGSNLKHYILVEKQILWGSRFKKDIDRTWTQSDTDARLILSSVT